MSGPIETNTDNHYAAMAAGRRRAMRTAGVVTLIMIIGVAAIGVIVANRPISISVNAAADAGRLVSVTGTGTIHVAPDIAIFNAGINVTAPTVREARNRAGVAANAVLAAMSALGISENDLRTVSINLYPSYPPICPVPYPMGTSSGSSSGSGGTTTPIPPIAPAPTLSDQPYPSVAPDNKPLPTYYCGPNGSTPSSYTFSQTIEVTVRNLDSVGDAIDAATKAGATSIDSLRFALSDPDKAAGQARTAAVADAKAKAQALTGAAGASLGAVHSLNETGYSSPFPYAYADKSAGGTPSTPVSPGVLDVSVTVNVVWSWEISQLLEVLLRAAQA